MPWSWTKILISGWTLTIFHPRMVFLLNPPEADKSRRQSALSLVRRSKLRLRARAWFSWSWIKILIRELEAPESAHADFTNLWMGTNYYLWGWIPFSLPRGTLRVPVDPDVHVLHTVFFWFPFEIHSSNFKNLSPIRFFRDKLFGPDAWDFMSFEGYYQ